MHLTIHHLYAEMMNMYGDRGNVISIKKRCEWRGITVDVVDVGRGERIRPTGADIFLFGGGQDREQELLAGDLAATKADDLKALSEDGAVILATCGGYQFLGQYYETPDGEKLEGLGLLDLRTEPRKPDEERLIGNALIQLPDGRRAVGFENHGGRTYLGEGAEPFGRTIAGYGNNGEDGTEGARYLNTIGTYLHGSLLPKNPWVTDLLIRTALGLDELEPLDDSLEHAAFESVAGRVSKGRGS